MISKGLIHRVNQIDLCYIPHTQIKDAINKMLRCIEMSSSSKEPVNFLLTGYAGTGKTTACNVILSKLNSNYEKHAIREGKEITVIPAFYAPVPNPVTIKGIAVSLIKSLGANFPSSGSAHDLTYRLGVLLKECETKVIILDEFHHLLEKDLGKTNDVKDWVKSLINEFKVPIILVGKPTCENIIDDDSQLARRFKYRFNLENLNFDIKAKSEYRAFVTGLIKSFGKYVEIYSYPDFSSRSVCFHLYAATSGNPNNTVDLIKEATLIALEDGREKVTNNDFIKAYESMAFPYSLTPMHNPFKLSHSKLLKVINKKVKKVK